MGFEVGGDGRWHGGMRDGLGPGLGPPEGEVMHRPGLVHGLNGLEGGPKDIQLAPSVSGLPQRPTMGVLDSHESRDAHGPGKLRHTREGKGGEAQGFQFMRDQSHGPAADGSGGDQENQLHLILQEDLSHGRHRFVQQDRRIDGVAHVRKMPGRHLTDLSSIGHLGQPP